MSSYVDLMGDVRWTDADHVERVEGTVRSTVSHTREHVLLRRFVAFLAHAIAPVLPDGPERQLLANFAQPLAPAAVGELAAAAAAFLQADTLAEQAKLDGARLDLALDYEHAEAALTALPPVTQPGVDPDAAVRAQLQAQIAAASQDTLDLVGEREAYRASQTPQVPQA